MPLRLETTDASANPVVAELRTFELGDRDRETRRQTYGTTDGGQRYVQDLLVADRVLEVAVRLMDLGERAQLLAAVRAAAYRVRPFTLAFVGGHHPVPLSTGLVLACPAGVVVSTGLGLSTGQDVLVEEATVTGAFLDQSELDLETERDGRYATTLRFYVPGGPVP